MPGITGIINKFQNESSGQTIKSMVQPMMHESFYSSGTYHNEEMGIIAGWVCQKGTFSDCLPITNERKSIILLFSGEIFSDPNIISDLHLHGHEFLDGSAEYLVHLYEEDEENFYSKLNGWFHGIIIDNRNNTITLFNDRYGISKVCYCMDSDRFLFSAEGKSLLNVFPRLRAFDPKGLSEIVNFGCVLENRSLFSGISMLPPASRWIFKTGMSIDKRQYFQPSQWESLPKLDNKKYYSQLKETFSKILPRYISNDGQTMMSMTGGLDTRMIIAALYPKSLPCYTFGGPFHETYDIRIARKIAQKCGQTHHTIRLDDGFFKNFSDLARKTVYISEGGHDVYGTHDLFFNQIARTFSPRRLTGKFGGEVLRGITTFKQNRTSKDIYHPDFKKDIQKSNAAVHHIRAETTNDLSFTIFREIPWHEYGRLAIEQSQLTFLTPYMDNDYIKLIYQAPYEVKKTPELSLRLIHEYNPSLSTIKTDQAVSGQTQSLLTQILHVFSRIQFKLDYIYFDGMPKNRIFSTIDKFITGLHLEKKILGNHKYLFYRQWFRNELKEIVKETLLDQKTFSRSHFNGHALEKMVNMHLSGTANYSDEINKALTIELVNRSLIEF